MYNVKFTSKSKPVYQRGHITGIINKISTRYPSKSNYSYHSFKHTLNNNGFHTKITKAKGVKAIHSLAKWKDEKQLNLWIHDNVHTEPFKVLVYSGLSNNDMGNYDLTQYISKHFTTGNMVKLRVFRTPYSIRCTAIKKLKDHQNVVL